jgi:hypothetical protein
MCWTLLHFEIEPNTTHQQSVIRKLLGHPNLRSGTGSLSAVARSMLIRGADFPKSRLYCGEPAVRRVCLSNNERYAIMQRRLLKLGAIGPRAAAVTATAVCFLMPAFPAFSSGIHQLLITENSDTSLTVSWDGSSITPTFVANDHWTFNTPVGIYLGPEISSGVPNGASIPEPGGSSITGPWNNVYTTSTTAAPYVTLVDVKSDVSTTSGTATVLANDVSGLAGDDAAGVPVYITFNDLGDSSRTTVPDNGSTVALLLMSGMALFGAARWLRPVQAS